jgi:uncharacterized membrane protein (Fun14 family)
MFLKARQSMKPESTSPGTRVAWGGLVAGLPLGPLRAEPPDAVAPQDAGSLFSEAFFLRVGFSFIVGLAAGFALKVAFKIALVVIGVMLVGVFALQYAGLAEVDWSGVELQYDTGADWLGTQGGALLDFMGRNLPSVASFLAGLAVGLKL